MAMSMLRISKLTDYATLVLSFMALTPDSILSATFIAAQLHLGLPTVSKILKILSAHHLVVSRLGMGGGYKLARASHEITLEEIVSAIEGNVAMTQCCSTHLNTCTIDALCSLKENWQIINKQIFLTLAKISLQDMLQPLQTPTDPIFKGIPIRQEALHGQ